MAFVVGAIVGGVIVAHDNHSNYSDWREHSRYREYGDSSMRSQISSLESRVSSKESEVENLRQRVNNNFNNRVAELKREKNYPALNKADANNIVNAVKADMKREIESEIQRDQQELAEIDRMISRINELELQSKQE